MTAELGITERTLQQAIVDGARVLGWLSYHTWLSKHSAPGFPDLVLMRPPRLILAELKSQTGVLTAAQGVWQAGLVACPGVEYYLWRPADWLAGTILEVLR